MRTQLIPLRDVSRDMSLVEEADEMTVAIAKVLDRLAKTFEADENFPESALIWAVAVFELRWTTSGGLIIAHHH